MTHLTMELLLASRERPSEPGSAAAREHLQGCDRCQTELERLHQRVARLRALPTLRAPRDQWPAVAARVHAERWRRGQRVAALVGLAMAASIAIVVVTGRAGMPGASPDAKVLTVQSIAEEIHQAKAQSRVIEDALRSFNPDARVLDGRTAGITQALEARIAEVDRAIETVELARQQARGELVRDLWRERVGLLDALVGVHVSRASEF